MERSAELEKELGRMYDAFTRGDGELIEEITTAREGLVFIGTDPGEWFEEVTSIRKLLEAQAGAGVNVEQGDIKAYEEGTVGWAADAGHFVLPDGNRVPFRMTAVFHRENGAWKLVQEHASVAISNEEAIGTDLS